MFDKFQTKVLIALLAVFAFGVAFSPSADAQKREITGTVVDETGDPVPGAAVMLKGSTSGVMTDLDGAFSIRVGENDILVVSFLGYQDVEVPVKGQNTVSIALEPLANVLEEVVKVAYGTQRKASVIGSITSVETQQLQAPIGQLSTGLAGKLAGVVAMQRTGEPGASAEFWIRGVNTFGDNKVTTPLILVDGVERSMDMVDVEDIASFSILKDATATALYGVRGGNGIVLITTRRGSESAPKVSVKFQSGMTSPTKLPEMATAGQFIDYLNTLYLANGDDPAISDYERRMYLSGADPDLYPNVDWIKTIFKDRAMTANVNVNVTGGTRRVRYYAGGSYYFEDGIFNVENNDRYNAQMNFRKFNFRTNVDIDITESTTLGMDLSTQFTMKNQPGAGLGDIYSYTLQNTPIGFPTIFSDGTFSNPRVGSNPYNMINNMGYVTNNTTNAQSTIALTQDFGEMITEGLKAKIQVSWDARNTSAVSRTILPKLYYTEGRDADGNIVYLEQNSTAGYINLSAAGNSGQTVLNVETSAVYERSFASAHRVSGMFMYYLRNRTNTSPGDYWGSFAYKSMGIAGRATYSYKDRYFGEFNFGYNGSENFSPGHRFGFFPSGAIGYMISNEPFWAPIKNWFSLLKFKASIGMVGSDSIGGSRRYGYNTTMNTSAAGASWGSRGPNYVTGITTGEIGNPNIEWETIIKRNLGVEANFFNDAVRFQLDYFRDNRDGIFIRRESLPSAVGINVQQYVNIGQMLNQGFDASLQLDYTFPSGLSLSARGNYTFCRNRILYDDKPSQVWAYKNTAMFASGQQRGLIAEGLFMTQEEIDAWPTQTFGPVEPGDIKYRDINGDGKVDADDYVPIGYGVMPEINYGFGFSLNYRGWDASVFFSGVGHVTRIISGNNLYGGAASNALVQGQIFADVAERSWSVTHLADAEYPRFSLAVPANNIVPSTYWQKDMSFMRLKNAEIGYTFPKKWMQKLGLSTVRIYAQGANLLTLSKFKLWDPELSSSYGNVYPLTKNVSLGLNINF
ncbi:MAG: TonB-dependent receptor [Bacteroidales bacterium]|nr:TonB-dependent receptor [Bacteroidales bacterium]